MDFIQSAFSLFHKGGLVMYPLALCSMFVAAIIAERYWFFRAETGDAAALRRELSPALAAGDWDKALAVCGGVNGSAAAVAYAGLERRSRDPQVVEKAMEAAASLKAAKLRDRLQYLDFVVTLSPLLGLLGTVVGMIQSFSIMNISEGQPFAITGGVGEALIATASGLCVAIFALIAHAYFARQLDKLVTDMEETAYCLLNEIRGESR
ncbi:MAG: MotA/TolQ/ExbB proton channel family protein [Sporomusaceae bacterium]|nr:MotA/TolQ/ExbB proton channel family protein [Sporomusaceae bacterium]